jgi:hypothetical protein
MTIVVDEPAPVIKRQFLDALACATRSHRTRHEPRSAPDFALQWLLHEGNRIGARARDVLGPGHLLPSAPRDVTRTASAAALAGRPGVLFEVSVSASGLIARADALVPCDGGWELIEVKASKFPEKGVPPADQLDDVAYTLFVARAAGVSVVRTSLLLLSRDYRLGENAPLLQKLDVTDAAAARADEFAMIAPQLVATLTQAERPAAVLSLTCKQCEYFAVDCVGRDVDDSVLRIPRLSASKLADLRPAERIRDVPAGARFTDAQQQAVDVIRSRGVHRNASVLATLDTVQWPACYLDFETAMPALPWFDGDGAYTTLPTQFSVHVCASPGNVTKHAEYLAPFTPDWRRELAERLLDALDGDGSIMVYSHYERTQLTAMAARFPDLAPRLMRLVSRLFDLEPCFKSGYIDHRYAGRSSIKQVLPVLVPELSYDDMAVGDGSSAAAVFCLMREGVIPDDQHVWWRQRLLQYCELDTMAMVRLHQSLEMLRA